MKRNINIHQAILATTICLVLISCKQAGQKVDENEASAKVTAMEKTALDRWARGDPWGYLDIFADEVTYYNPFENKRIDGLDSMKKYYGDQAGQIFIDKYDMTNIKVQVHGNIAILSYNLFNYKKQADGSLKLSTKWNSTKVYCFLKDEWKIIHNHWSFLQPDVKQQTL